ncbi:MAG TPA: hypothetical protein VIZ65_08105 [Cellvibrionaceae bacterium]
MNKSDGECTVAFGRRCHFQWFCSYRASFITLFFSGFMGFLTEFTYRFTAVVEFGAVDLRRFEQHAQNAQLIDQIQSLSGHIDARL